MKSFQSFQTFRLYREYQDDILVKAFLECQKRSLVNRRRGNHSLGPKKSRALPFVPMSFQLSQSYYRVFTWRFPSTLCSESYQFLLKLKEAGKHNQASRFSFKDQDDPFASEMVTFPLDGSGGYCAAVLALFALGQVSVDVTIPEQIVVVDSTMVENEVIKSLGKEGLEEEEEEEEEEEDDIEEGATSKRQVEVKAHQASHTNYLLMRGYYAPGIVSTRNLSPTDNIVVSSCQVKLKLRETPARGSLMVQEPPDLESMPVGASCLPSSFTRRLNVQEGGGGDAASLLQALERFSYGPGDVAAVLEVIHAIEAASHFGVDKMDLARQFQHYEEASADRVRLLPQYIQDLLDLEQVVEVGAYTLRLVARRFAGPWLLHSVFLREDDTPRVWGKDSDLPQDQAESSCQKEEKEKGLKRAISSPAASEEELEKKRPKTAEEEEEEGQTVDTALQGTEHLSEGAGRPVLHAGGTGTHTVHGGARMAEGPEATGDGSAGAMGQQGIHPCEKQVVGLSGKEDLDCDADAASSELCRSDLAQQEGLDHMSGCPTGKVLLAEQKRVGGNISFIGRPWRIVDGSLNKPVCKGIMEGVLCHIMTKPGITEAALRHHYRGVLQPVALLEILQGLESLGCIRRFHLEPPRAASLFSAPLPEELVPRPRLSQATAAFYEPQPDCALRMGRVFPYELNWNKWGGLQGGPL